MAYIMSVCREFSFDRPTILISIRFLAGILVFCSCFGVFVVETAKCEPIRIRMCASMPYNATQFPNLLHHSTQTNAGLYLDQFLPLVEVNCSAQLVFYLCAVCVPVCPIRFGHEVIPPCRAVCQTVRNGCEPVLARYNISWPSELSCNELPRHETGVCISPEAIDLLPQSNMNVSFEMDPTNRVRPTKQTKEDCNCQRRLRRPPPRSAYMKQQFDYVIGGTYLRSRRIAGQLVFISFRVTQIIEKSKTPILMHRTVELWTDNQCLCYRFTKMTQYLLMGFEDGQKKMLIFDDRTIVEPWKRNWPKYIKKWKSRKRQRQRRRKQESTVHQTNITETTTAAK